MPDSIELQGVKFMHDHNVAHRDCLNGSNIMMEGIMFPEAFHDGDSRFKRDYSESFTLAPSAPRSITSLIPASESLQFTPPEIHLRLSQPFLVATNPPLSL
ncbi:hypothetical protein B0H17DRAFT_1097456 [Mycena rosella]|uniref:Protein kinase domain-containing protein n=1 Tax=Mycena rosella TaxID=1033263 RepID=A0AAD7G468_MYCRO|nr:hypothetical protein B0H17DRAFT_1106823 [Mycena rosella]KAJ7658027.1 hypothetical protein B0H17DRAFT_1097456 [Mycena rosella]